MSKYNPHYKRPMAEISCACGKKRKIRRSQLKQKSKCAECAQRQGQTKSAQTRSRSPEQNAASDAWFCYNQNARKKGIAFQLTRQEFERLRKAACDYCGAEAPNGIDRTDNNKGYTTANTVACCKACNFAKGSATRQQFLRWAKKLNEHQSLLQRQRPEMLRMAKQPNGCRAYKAGQNMQQIDFGPGPGKPEAI